MSFPRYPEYKNSGVEWLGEVPAHWATLKLKHLARIRNGRDYKAVEVESEGYPVIGSGGPFSLASTYLYDGESLLLGRKGTVEKPLYVNGPFWTVDTMFYTELSEWASGRFLYYYATCFRFRHHQLLGLVLAHGPTKRLHRHATGRKFTPIGKAQAAS